VWCHVHCLLEWCYSTITKSAAYYTVLWHAQQRHADLTRVSLINQQTMPTVACPTSWTVPNLKAFAWKAQIIRWCTLFYHSRAFHHLKQRAYTCKLRRVDFVINHEKRIRRFSLLAESRLLLPASPNNADFCWDLYRICSKAGANASVSVYQTRNYRDARGVQRVRHFTYLVYANLNATCTRSQARGAKQQIYT
jgi:hypothetical protein